MNILKLQRRPVANLTLEQNVAVEHLGLEPLPGHVLVVFERRDQGGAVFSRLVNSGESFASRFRIPFRDLSQKYFAIAVNDSVLSYAFNHSIVLDDGSEEFTINFHLTYRVSDPKKVAEILEHDPLRQLRDEAVRVIGRNCAKRKVEMFRDRFRDLERIVIESESVRLRPYAVELGFKIISIDLDKSLPDYQRKVIDQRKRAQSERQRHVIQQDVTRAKQKASRAWEQELQKDDVDNKFDLRAPVLAKTLELQQKEDELHRAEQNRRLREFQTDTVGQALTNVGANINTSADLREGYEVAREISFNTQPVGNAIPATEAPLGATQRTGGEAQTKGIEDSEQTTLDSELIVEGVEQSLPGEVWKNETLRLIKLMEEAGADADTTMRVREDLEAIAAQYFPPPDILQPVSSSPPDETRLLDSVMCSVFAPPAACSGANILVQVFAHLSDESETVKRIATEFDEQAKRLAAKLLDNQISRESKLTFCISMPGLEIDEPVQELVWLGQPDAVQFGVRVPKDIKEQEVIGTIYVSQNGVPFGHAKFLLRIVNVSNALVARDTVPRKMSTWKHYEYAFISYATVDRPEVVKRVQMLSRFHIDFFQDLLTLEPGEHWEKTIYENIDKSDVFFLFWSSAARDSEWVMKELQYALERKGKDPHGVPEIVPVIIEGPPPVPPPAELKGIHFNDRFIYFINTQ